MRARQIISIVVAVACGIIIGLALSGNSGILANTYSYGEKEPYIPGCRWTQVQFSCGRRALSLVQLDRYGHVIIRPRSYR